MAITIEEEKKGVNWVGVIVGVIVAVSLFVAAYYLFFKRPELIEVTSLGRLEELQNVSQITFDPATLLESPEFKVLRQFGRDITLPTPGRDNPFRPY